MFGRLYYLENNLNSVLQLRDYLIWIYEEIFNACMDLNISRQHKSTKQLEQIGNI